MNPKRNKTKNLLKVCFGIIILILLMSLLNALEFTDKTKGDFDNGTYNKTLYNLSINAIQLNTSFNDGVFISRVFDSSALSIWENISWNEGLPYGEKLPNNQYDEEANNILRGINMSKNVLLMHLDEESGTLIDKSGYGNNGTQYGGITYNMVGKINKSIKLDGINDKINTIEQIPLNFTKKFSYGAWFKADSFSTWAGIMSRMRGWPNGYNLQVGTSQKIACGWGVYTNSNTMPNKDEWYHAVCVYNGSEMKLYVNGVLQNDVDQKEMGIGVDDLQIGVFYTRSGSGISLPFNGSIDEVFVFNRTLSQQEIQNMYLRGALRLNVSVRSCDDANCNGEEWNKTFEKPSKQQLELEENRYFQYSVKFLKDNSTEISPELYNITIEYSILDNTPPKINLESPENNTINKTNRIPEFIFNATDETKTILNCSLWMNFTKDGVAERKATNSSVKNYTLTIITPDSALTNGLYNWWIECSDGININVSEKRLINISVPDLIPPTITLINPENNNLNRTNNTPEFQFVPEDNKAEKLNCELWLNATKNGIPTPYGTNNLAENGTVNIIIANSSLENRNYTWWISCNDTINVNISEKRKIEFLVDNIPPNVTFITPTKNQKNVDFSEVNFSGVLKDDIALKNVSLYSNYKGTWQFIENKILSGVKQTVSFLKNILFTNQFVNNNFQWNFLVYDNKSKSNWGTINQTFSNWDRGSYANTQYNTTTNAVTLIDYLSDGTYTSEIFDAGDVVGWKNISWSKRTANAELPDNKKNIGIDMRDNQLLLHLNDGNLATNFIDTSGEGNNGFCSGGSCPTWNSTGKYNGAYKFDGGDVISISENTKLNFTKKLSYGAWFKADSFSTWAGIMSRMRSWPNGYNLQVGTNNKIACGWGVYTKSNTMPNKDEWYHAVCVYNGSEMKLYVNGVLQNDVDQGTLNVGEDDMKLGVFYTSNSIYFNGSIDEVFVFNRTLSQQEIQNMYLKSAKKLNLYIRSCDDANCNGESWSEALENSTLTQLPVENNRYFQYKTFMESIGLDRTPELFNITINYGNADYEKPEITLQSPQDKKGDKGNETIFRYKVNDESIIKNCSLILNNEIKRTNQSIEKDKTQEFKISRLSSGEYYWKINCTDINNNENSSETRKITIIPSYEFNGRTTEFSEVDIENITNLLIENSSVGLINFTENINLSGGLNINEYVIISKNIISIDSIHAPQLNKSAKLTFYNLSIINPIILKNGKACTECNILEYTSDKNLTFEVESFSNYSASENSQLSIWDDTDNYRIFGGNIKFYANYTNHTDNQAITTANCYINFTDYSIIMNYNVSSELYEYNRTLPTGVHYYNITCSATGYTTINLTDYASINDIHAPSGANITKIKSERGIIQKPESSEAIAGNITELNIQGKSITQSWQGYYGNVSGAIQLIDSKKNVMYNWSSTSYTGEVYATRTFDINFPTIKCAENSEIKAEEEFIGQNKNDTDSVTNTFNKKSHPEFYVGTIKINTNSCNSTNLYDFTGKQNSYFYEILLTDGASNMIYTSILEQNRTGFDSRIHDFEMIVGENGHNTDTRITNYYFYVELY